MKVLIDTNVLLDVFIKREHHYLDSAKTLSLHHKGFISGIVSAISINNIYYIVNKLKDRQTAEYVVDHLLKFYLVENLTVELLKQARTLSKIDFEDAIQLFTAIHSNCEIIITRNKTDYPKNFIRILTPTEFLTKLND